MGFLSNTFNPGKADLDASNAASAASVFNSGGFSGPGGISGGFDFSTGQSTSDLGSFDPMLQGFQGMAQQGFDQASGGLSQSFQDAAGAAKGQLGAPMDVQRMGNQDNFAGLGQMFKKSMQTANADPFELGAGISEKLRAISERRNNRQVNKTFARLQASGNLGSSAGISRAGDLERNIMEQGMKFDLAGLQAGQGLQKDAFGRAMGAVQGREAIGGRQFQEQMAQQAFGDKRALQSFGVDQQMFQNDMTNQSNAINMANAGGQGASSIAQLPIAFQDAALRQQQASSNSNMANATNLSNNAGQRESGFMNALTTAGSFASAMSGFAMPSFG